MKDYGRVLTLIINKISRTILKSGLVIIPLLITGKFVISALGMVLLMFMTDFVKISLSTDHAHPSASPESWNIAPLAANPSRNRLEGRRGFEGEP